MRKKIVHIISNAVFEDGVANYVLMLSIELKKNGIEQMAIVINNYDLEFIKKFEENGIHVCLNKIDAKYTANRYVKYFYNFFMIGVNKKFKTASTFIDEKSDSLIFYHGEEPELMRLFVKSQLPSVNVIHGENFFPIFPLQKILLKKSRKLFNHSVILDEKYKNYVERNYTIIRTGIDNNEYAAINSKIGDELVLGYMGRLSREKNIHLMIELVDKLIYSGINCRLLIAGDGNEKKYLNNLILKNKLESKIELLGTVKNKKLFYSIINLLLILSKCEVMPLTLLEALSAGVPIISSNVGAIKKIIDNEENGFIVDNWDLKLIEKKIKKIAADPDYFIQLSNNARKKSFEFNIDMMTNAYIDLINKLYNEQD